MNTLRISLAAIAVVLAAGLGYFCLLLIGLTGWSLSSQSGGERLTEALPLLVGAALLGMAAVLVLIAGFGGRRWWLASLGAAPAIVQAFMLL